MKKHRITALILATALPISAVSCTFDDLVKSSSSESSLEFEENPVSESASEKYSSIEIDMIKEHISELQENTESAGNSAKVQEGINTLLNDLDQISEDLTYITIDYYMDWYNEDLEEEYDKIYESYYIATELLTYTFSNGYKVDEYSELFEPYVDLEYLDYYTDRAMSMQRLEGYVKVDYEVMDDYLDDYYSIIQDTKKKNKTKNLEAAEVYLDILSSYDTETFYDHYDRDFSADEILELSKIVRNELIPAGEKIEEIFFDIPYADDIFDDPVEFDDPFETLSLYTASLSSDIANSAELLIKDELYALASGSKCYEGSFTTDLPLENSAMIYTYMYGDCYDLLTAIHEFGHFHASFYDETPTYLMQNNIDIAEIQSQGMEMIFMPLYDDIYEDQADAMRILKLYDMLDSVISGFIIGEFEYTVLKNLDTMTPEDVVDYFDSLMEEYNYDTDLYYISHLFEQPGYYISYGVSALAALDIWKTSLNDHDKAVEMYENIAKVKCNSGEYQFRSALESCGFNDVLNEQYIKTLSAEMLAYAESIR